MKPTKYTIVGCNLMFGATEETFLECAKCSLRRDDVECLDNIAVGERHYIYQKRRG
ncbi:MAG: hypothetical protein WCX48_09710 [Bacteroidales bacterium]